MSSNGIEFRVFQNGDEAALNESFNRVFGAERSLDEWAFRFRAIGSARPILMATRGGHILASVAGVATRLTVAGTMVDVLEVVEAFAVDDPAGEGEQRSLLDRALGAFVDQFGRSGRFPLIFISPGDAASVEPVGCSCGELLKLPSVTTLCRKTPARWGSRRLFYRAEAGRDWEPRLDGLWKRVRHGYATSTVRDADFALRRYAGSPGVKFHRFVVLPRFSRRAAAYAVFKIEDDCCRWVDFLWDHDQPGALDLVIHLSSRLAAQTDADCERVILGGDQTGLARLEAQGFETEQLRDDLSLQILFSDPKRVPGGFPDRLYMTAVDLEKI